MLKEENINYFSTPLYQELLSNFQRGEWEAGISQLDNLIGKYPLEIDLRTLRQEMLLRASIDRDEQHDNVTKKFRRARLWILRLVILVGFAGVIFFGFRTYNSWINKQWDAARQNLAKRVEGIDISIKFRNAQNLLLANRPEEAKALFGEVASVNPDFPALQENISQADKMIALESSYQEATQLVASGDYPAALNKFEEISTQSPHYKDVDIQIATIKKNYLLTDSFNKAEQAYSEEYWTIAISGYENVRSSDPQFKTDYIEGQLFNSYINAAEAALSKETNTMEDLSLAEDYYRKALAIRPTDAKIIAKRAEARTAIEDRLVNSYLKAGQDVLIGKADSIAALREAQKYFNQALMLHPGDSRVYHQVDMAQNYLKGVDNYHKGLWSDAIADLETIYKDEPGYADGTARQTLYEAYIARGETGLATGDYADALLDFQHGALIAQQSPNSALRLFEAQLKIADTTALLGNYKEAVQIYQAAIQLGGLRTLAEEKKSKLTTSLVKADTLAEAYNYKVAYQVYSSALHDITDLYKMNEVMVSNGDYLTMLARRYNSTVEAILAANNIHDENDLLPNRTLIIPSLQLEINSKP